MFISGLEAAVAAVPAISQSCLYSEFSRRVIAECVFNSFSLWALEQEMKKLSSRPRANPSWEYLRIFISVNIDLRMRIWITDAAFLVNFSVVLTGSLGQAYQRLVSFAHLFSLTPPCFQSIVQSSREKLFNKEHWFLWDKGMECHIS